MKMKKNQYSNNQNNKYIINPKGERVLVYVRIRPFNEDELNKDSSSAIEVIDTKNNAMICNLKQYNKII
jgi:hypothetical protein